MEPVKGIERYTRRPGPGGETGGSYYRIRCRHCSSVFERKARKYSGPPPDLEGEVLPEAKKAGWDVLHGARRAMCPGCRGVLAQAKAKKEAKIMVTKPTPTPKPRTEPGEVVPLKPAVAGKAEAPPSMDIDAAFLIRDKLGEVYLDAQRGYGEGWTDKKVAESLTVPRDWVRQVRCKVYGASSAGGAEDFAPVLNEARAVLAAAKDLTEQGLKVQQEVAVFERARGEVLAQVGRLERRLADIEKAVG